MPGNNFGKPETSDKRRRARGFTLLEILVVLGLFSLLGVVIINVYLMALSAQRQTSYRQKTLSNIRYIIETIARQVRTSEIDYNYYIDNDKYPLAYPNSELALFNQAGKSFVYRFDETRGELQLETDSQIYLLNNTSEVKIEKLYFYISPVYNPFREERCNRNIGTTGCSASSVSVGGCTIDTIDEPINEFGYLSGFCQCDSADDCNTGFCDLDAIKESQPSDLDLGLCLPPNEQPRLTIVLGFRSQGVGVEEKKAIFLQTTVSSRIYKR